MQLIHDFLKLRDSLTDSLYQKHYDYWLMITLILFTIHAVMIRNQQKVEGYGQ